jgi:hypothetical protein
MALMVPAAMLSVLRTVCVKTVLTDVLGGAVTVWCLLLSVTCSSTFAMDSQQNTGN